MIGKSPMSRILLTLCIVGFGYATPTCGLDDRPKLKHGTFPDESVTVGQEARAFRLVVPNSVDLAKPAPLVVAYHGMLIDSKDVMPKYTKLSQLAADKKFILIYPEAQGKLWGIAPDKVKADLAFFDVLLAEAKKRYRID